ncbi:ATP-binding cassette domain-containing protein [Thermodesulfatator atlanticus]|uniref:ATP-binding cassette domain-containing protein n=1 Tax=Thermodesulfatator atlanticus TaxID=501497 RepID=UPI0003B75DA3|nr:ATP-binding cassette domain-containing protein [Thermodesulfatator atlanticus]
MCLLVNVEKKLPGFTLRAHFSLKNGEILILWGPSGSGKTTLLRLLAGLEKPDKGYISYHKEIFVDTAKNIFLPPRKRQLGYVFQEGILFPHFSLEKNITFTAKEKSLGLDCLKKLGLWELRKRKPFEVSGGERQRAAFCQALARKPCLLLLDEPFSALDEKNKELAISYLKDWQSKTKATLCLITHHKDDALKFQAKWLYVNRGESNFEK